jgi:hypothetical protein
MITNPIKESINFKTSAEYCHNFQLHKELLKLLRP